MIKNNTVPAVLRRIADHCEATEILDMRFSKSIKNMILQLEKDELLNLVEWAKTLDKDIEGDK